MLLKKPGCFILLLFCNYFLDAQTVIINGENTKRDLKWEDFTGTPDHSVDLYAYTYWNINYNWDAFPFKGDTALCKVKVTVELGKHSWKKADKVTDRLLQHEQGHFNIGWLCAISFQQRINKTVLFRHNYESQIAAIFQEELEKYRKMERQYDTETKHYHDLEHQKKWDLFFKRQLEKYR